MGLATPWAASSAVSSGPVHQIPRSFANITGVLGDGEQIPLFWLRYGGSASSVGFAIYSSASDRHQDALLRTGLPTGTLC